MPKDGLGRSLIRPRKTLSGRAIRRLRQQEQRHGDAALPIGLESANSVLDRPDWEELLVQADLSGRSFTAERSEHALRNLNEPQLVTSTVSGTNAENSSRLATRAAHDDADWPQQPLGLPERPQWNSEMRAEDLDAAERLAFYRWRKALDSLEIELDSQMERSPLVGRPRSLTPYEKNLQVWRQLWRVLERSQLIVQVLDARSPLLFYSPDLERYIRERYPEKKMVLLLNKADLLTRAARKAWQRYFTDQGIQVWFFSAIYPQGETGILMHASEHLAARSSLDKTTSDSAAVQREMISNPGSVVEQERHHGVAPTADVLDPSPTLCFRTKRANIKTDPFSEERKRLEPDQQTTGTRSSQGENTGGMKIDPSIRLCSRTELLTCFRQTLRIDTTDQQPDHDGHVQQRRTVGFVGYPNVGKSSTLNSLLGRTQVAVGPNPGKTKHLQTHILDDNLMLCDAPGLVFPQWVHDRAELICAGVVPIDHAGDLTQAIELICSRIPAAKLAEHYGLRLPPRLATPNIKDASWAASAFLEALAVARGFRSAHALADHQRAARLVLKDYVRGDLLYVHWPPKRSRSPSDASVCSE